MFNLLMSFLIDPKDASNASKQELGWFAEVVWARETCQKKAIEKNHLQIVRKPASPREYHREILACSLTQCS